MGEDSHLVHRWVITCSLCRSGAPSVGCQWRSCRCTRTCSCASCWMIRSEPSPHEQNNHSVNNNKDFFFYLCQICLFHIFCLMTDQPHHTAEAPRKKMGLISCLHTCRHPFDTSTHSGRGRCPPPLRDVGHVGVVGVPQQRTSSFRRARLPVVTSDFLLPLPLCCCCGCRRLTLPGVSSC